MSAGPAVINMQTVQSKRREREDDEMPVVTLTARVGLAGGANVRLTVRPLVAVLADASGGVPRVEVHVEGGSSVILEGAPLAALLKDSIKFLKDAGSGAEQAHDHVFGLAVTFDIAMSSFVTIEQPPFLVAEAHTFVHPSGAVALRILGEKRPRVRGPEHAPAPEGEAEERPSFDLQLQSRRGAWLAATLEDALRGLEPDSGDTADATLN